MSATDKKTQTDHSEPETEFADRKARQYREIHRKDAFVTKHEELFFKVDGRNPLTETDEEFDERRELEALEEQDYNRAFAREDRDYND
jgi:hypothetical protein